jgi:hypothetical protein
MNQVTNDKTSLGALFTPEYSVLLLIDHQPFQVSAIQNIDPAQMINNTVALAKTGFRWRGINSDTDNGVR